MMESSPATAGGFSARSLLPLGFCAVFLLMAAALFESYRMQDSMHGSPAALTMYDRDDALLERMRQGLNESQNVVRDFLLQSASIELYLTNLRGCEAEIMEALEEMERLPAAKPANVDARETFREYFQALRALAAWTEETRNRQAANILSTQIPQLRAPADRAVGEMFEAGQEGRRKIQAAAVSNGQARVNRIFILLGSNLILALAVAGLNLAYAHELSREAQAKVGEIARAKADMQQLSARLLTVQEEERRRLSRDLHDGIGQLLTALRIEISHVGHEAGGLAGADQARLQRARSLAEEAVRSTRDIALLLRPSHLDDLGLEAALQWQAEDFRRRTGIPCRFAAAGLEAQLPDAWKTCVYRIVQEALHNCEKHAAPTQVQVCVSQEPENLTLEVQDDGVGFELDAHGGPRRAAGLGLLGMRERAAILGGALQMTSAPGRGTKIRVELPMAPLPPRDLPAPTAEVRARGEVKA